ncbi:MAG TPA: DMT family transporter [Candidatus Saccharimonadia bacterium]|nr:DMT family transporter [Candidatus Saccharimonadia bacterium]
MNGTLIATFAGLVTAFCFGAGDWLTPRSKRKLAPYEISFAVYLIGMLMYSLLFLGFSPHWPAVGQSLQLIGASLLISIGYVVFVKALTEGAVGIVVPLSGVYPLVTLLLSVVFLSQDFKYLQILAMGLIVVGSVLLAYEKNHQKMPLRQLHKATILTFVAVVLWGVGFFIINPLVPKLQWQVILIITEVVGFIFSAVVAVAVYRSETYAVVKRAVTDKIIAVAGILLATGALALYLGASHAGSVIVPTVLSSLSPLISSGLGAVVDHEQLGWLKRLGAVVAVTGIIVLNLA